MTLPILLAAAEAATPGIPETFGLEVKVVIIQIFGFLVLAGVLYWFAIKPILATMGTRVSKIESGLKYAEEMKAKLEAAQAAYEAKLKEAQIKSQQIVAETQKSSKEFAEKQQKEAVEQSAAMISKALATIELEKAKMLAEARTEIARLVVVTTQRVLAKELSEADRTRYTEAAAKELAQV
jgi:F-type H+-transporting ATPase subunit b